MNAIRTVLVTGATGQQGGSVVDALLAADGYDVRGLTRDASSDRARALADRGVTVVEGDLSRRRDLRRAMADVDGVFLVTDYWSAGRAGEVRQGRNAVLAARDAGVAHLVFSSVWHADRAPDLEHFRSKAAVEAVLARAGVPYTVVRPAYLTSNLDARREQVEAGDLALPLSPSTRLPVLDVADLGRVVARVFAAPGRFDGRTIDLAGDAVTLAGMAAALGRVLDREVTPRRVPRPAAVESMGAEMAATYRWYDRTSARADPAAVTRATGVRPRTFEASMRARWGEGVAADADGEPSAVGAA